jgi:hypothetical protein
VFLRILAELDYPPIWMVSPEQFKNVEGISTKGSYGISSTKYPIFTIQSGLRGKVRANTIYHECFHILFPSRPHWWVENASEVMARGGGRGYYAKKYNKSIEDMPPRSYILKLAKRASKRMKEK